MVTENRSWNEHKIVSDLLWDDYLKAKDKDVDAMKAAISSYLGESTDYWGWDRQRPLVIEGKYAIRFVDK